MVAFQVVVVVGAPQVQPRACEVLDGVRLLSKFNSRFDHRLQITSSDYRALDAWFCQVSRINGDAPQLPSAFRLPARLYVNARLSQTPVSSGTNRSLRGGPPATIYTVRSAVRAIPRRLRRAAPRVWSGLCAANRCRALPSASCAQAAVRPGLPDNTRWKFPDVNVYSRNKPVVSRTAFWREAFGSWSRLDMLATLTAAQG